VIKQCFPELKHILFDGLDSASGIFLFCFRRQFTSIHLPCPQQKSLSVPGSNKAPSPFPFNSGPIRDPVKNIGAGTGKTPMENGDAALARTKMKRSKRQNLALGA